jgi:Chaperone of endosialidase/Head domain of trimeric autotransporter adhesin
MKRIILTSAIVFIGFIGLAKAQTTDFTYQGKLNNGGVAANGLYNLKFDLYDSLTAGILLKSITVTGVQVTNGIFNVSLDFRVGLQNRTAFADGLPKYLEIWATNTGIFTTPLSPRQQVKSTPYAIRSIYADSAANANSLGGFFANDYAVKTIDNTFSANQIFNGNITQTGGLVSLNPTNGFVVTGSLGGLIPIEGAGIRMMWYPGKAAFRAGQDDLAAWNDTNVGSYSTAFGRNNGASGNSSFTAGADNAASGAVSTALGFSTVASGNYSTALGYQSLALSEGSFVYGDRSSGSSTISNGVNSFTVRAAGGYRLFTNSSQNTGVSLSSGGGSWANLSDRNAKDNIASVDSRDIFRRVLNLPISTWNYKGQQYRHIGPMAQDFYSIFNVGENDKTITTVDPDGIALAAIQGLNTELNEQLKNRDSKINELQTKIKNQEMLLNGLKNLVCSKQRDAKVCR